MSYRILADAPVRRRGPYTLRPITGADVEDIRGWRNAQLAVLRQAEPIDAEQQQRYFAEVVAPDFAREHPAQVLHTLLRDGRRIGYGGMTHIDWAARRGELSSLVATERAADPDLYTADLTAFLALAVDGVAFADLGLRRVFAETYDVRPHHVALLEAAGFEPEGRLREHARVGDGWVDSLLHGRLSGDVAP